uniref:Uncharacterized protein LOC105062774 isoform X2 n=1 Tax=Camelus bactrianus TaxID=9837 RepID=A0A9W3FWB1_CAMBA|nr:uncharacterized protein LOC105062774 isoform X2 [Camelus bactrianus]
MNQRLLTRESGCGPSSRRTEPREDCKGPHLDHDVFCDRQEPRDPNRGTGSAPASRGSGGQGAASRACRIPSQEPGTTRGVCPEGGRQDGPGPWKSVSSPKDSGLLKRKSDGSLWDPANSPGTSAGPPPAAGSARAWAGRGRTKPNLCLENGPAAGGPEGCGAVDRGGEPWGL